MAASPQASDAAAPPRRLRVVVMGVSGTGKSTVAEGLAQALGLDCVDGDHLHSPENVAKMRAGTPLTDADRWPWLDRIGARLCRAGDAAGGDGDAADGGGAGAGPAEGGSGSRGGVVVSCSALRRAYRDRLRAAAPGVRFVFLDGTPEVIRARMQARQNHYMPAGLLDSQLQTLERPAPDESDVVRVDIDAPLPAVIDVAVGAVRGRAERAALPAGSGAPGGRALGH